MTWPTAKHAHAREALGARKTHYWRRGWGKTTEQKMAVVLRDPEWCRLVD